MNSTPYRDVSSRSQFLPYAPAPRPRVVTVAADAIKGLRENNVLRHLLPVGAGQASGFAAAGRSMVRVAHAVFVYCSRGQGWCEIRGHRFGVNAGELFVIPAGAVYAYGPSVACPWTIFWAQARGENVKCFLAEFGNAAEGGTFRVGNDPQLLALFQETLATLEASQSTAALLCASQALAHLLGFLVWSHSRVTQPELDVEDKIERTVAYMNQHLNKPLRVATLAALAGMSPSHFTALFKRQTGCPPIDYFIRLRMRRACRLLEETALSVKEVAAALGYDDPFYFSRLFKAVNHAAPTDYRASRRPARQTSAEQLVCAEAVAA